MNFNTQLSIYYAQISINAFTNGKPKPALAQFTPANFSLNTSATGETNFESGKMRSLHVGHVYPAGAVVAGNSLAYLSKHAQ